ncbi:MAG: DNA-directed RNA polymerase subunit alpha, partial [Planctomycetaceae bacterium]
DSTRVLRLEKSTKGPVTGADIQVDEAVEIVNKDLVLATLTDDVPFEIEMVVENGRGYLPAGEQSQAAPEIGIIPVDAVFSPVTRVKYDVEETRVGQKTNYDKLTLEIWTNGTVTPEMALVEAAKILRKHLNPFVGYTQPGPSLSLPAAGGLFGAVEAPLESRLGMLVSDLRLSLRANNCFDEAGITTLRDLVSRSRDELLGMRNLGDTTLQEVEEKLRELGLHLGMEMPAEAGA